MITLKLNANPKLIKQFPIDPYNDISINFEDKEYKLVKAHLWLESHFFSDFFGKYPKNSILEINERFNARLFEGVLKCFYGKRSLFQRLNKISGGILTIHEQDILETYKICKFLKIDVLLMSLQEEIRNQFRDLNFFLIYTLAFTEQIDDLLRHCQTFLQENKFQILQENFQESKKQCFSIQNLTEEAFIYLLKFHNQTANKVCQFFIEQYLVQEKIQLQILDTASNTSSPLVVKQQKSQNKQQQQQGLSPIQIYALIQQYYQNKLLNPRDANEKIQSFITKFINKSTLTANEYYVIYHQSLQQSQDVSQSFCTQSFCVNNTEILIMSVNDQIKVNINWLDLFQNHHIDTLNDIQKLQKVIYQQKQQLDDLQQSYIYQNNQELKLIEKLQKQINSFTEQIHEKLHQIQEQNDVINDLQIQLKILKEQQKQQIELDKELQKQKSNSTKKLQEQCSYCDESFIEDVHQVSIKNPLISASKREKVQCFIHQNLEQIEAIDFSDEEIPTIVQQPVSLKAKNPQTGDFSLVDSKILTTKTYNDLQDFFFDSNQGESFDLLQVFSENEGFERKQFFKKLTGNEGHLFLIQLAPPFSDIIGAYSSIQWSPLAFGFKHDDEAFMFSLTKNTKYPIQQPSKAVYFDSKLLIGFGHDLKIYEKCNLVTENFAGLSDIYGPKYALQLQFTNSKFFRVEHLEVYEVQLYNMIEEKIE